MTKQTKIGELELKHTQTLCDLMQSYELAIEHGDDYMLDHYWESFKEVYDILYKRLE